MYYLYIWKYIITCEYHITFMHGNTLMGGGGSVPQKLYSTNYWKKFYLMQNEQIL